MLGDIKKENVEFTADLIQIQHKSRFTKKYTKGNIVSDSLKQ